MGESEWGDAVQDRFSHYRSHRGGREVVVRPPRGLGYFFPVRDFSRAGIGCITSRKTPEDLELLAFIHGISVAEVKKRGLGR